MTALDAGDLAFWTRKITPAALQRVRRSVDRAPAGVCRIHIAAFDEKRHHARSSVVMKKTIVWPSRAGSGSSPVPAVLANAAPSLTPAQVWAPALNELKGTRGLGKIEMQLPPGVRAIDLRGLHVFAPGECPAVDVRCLSHETVYFLGPRTCLVRQPATGSRPAMAPSLYFPCDDKGSAIPGLDPWDVPGLVHVARAEGWIGTDAWSAHNAGLQKRVWEKNLNCEVDGLAANFALERKQLPNDPYRGKVRCCDLSPAWERWALSPPLMGEERSMRPFEDKAFIARIPRDCDVWSTATPVDCAAWETSLSDEFRRMSRQETRLYRDFQPNHTTRHLLRTELTHRERNGVVVYSADFYDPNRTGAVLRTIFTRPDEACELGMTPARFGLDQYVTEGLILVTDSKGAGLGRGDALRYASAQARSTGRWAWHACTRDAVVRTWHEWVRALLRDDEPAVLATLTDWLADPAPDLDVLHSMVEVARTGSELRVSPMVVAIARGNVVAVRALVGFLARIPVDKLSPSMAARIAVDAVSTPKLEEWQARLRQHVPALHGAQLDGIQAIGDALPHFRTDVLDIRNARAVLPKEECAALYCGIAFSDASDAAKMRLGKQLVGTFPGDPLDEPEREARARARTRPSARARRRAPARPSAGEAQARSVRDSRRSTAR